MHPARYIAKLLGWARVDHVEQDKLPVTRNMRGGTSYKLGGIKPAKAEQYIFRQPYVALFPRVGCGQTEGQ